MANIMKSKKSRKSRKSKNKNRKIRKSKKMRGGGNYLPADTGEKIEIDNLESIIRIGEYYICEEGICNKYNYSGGRFDPVSRGPTISLGYLTGRADRTKTEIYKVKQENE